MSHPGEPVDETDTMLESGLPGLTLSRAWQWGLLIPILLHVVAVFSEPYHFFSRSEVVPEAVDARLLRSPLQSYTQFMYLDHGYFFFAPNPGPGHLLRITASQDPITVPQEVVTEEEVRRIQFPDRNTMWPRLLYHRYFMLSEFYYSRYAPIELNDELRQDPGFVERWRRDRRFYTKLQSSIADHIKYKTGETFVRIDRLERALPDRASILQKGISTSDPRWISILPETMELPASPGSGLVAPSVSSVPIPPTEPIPARPNQDSNRTRLPSAGPAAMGTPLRNSAPEEVKGNMP